MHPIPPPLLGKTIDLVHGLGTTAEEVATTLREKKIRGYPELDEACPVAQYLSKELSTKDELVNVHVGSGAVVIIPKEMKGAFHFDTQPWIADFIHAFDHGTYPDLIEHEGEGCREFVYCKQVQAEAMFAEFPQCEFDHDPDCPALVCLCGYHIKPMGYRDPTNVVPLEV